MKFMLETMTTTLDRFFSITDSTARVLGGGVSLRYEGRLMPTYNTITGDIFSQAWTEGCPQEILLKEAGLDFETLTGDLHKLVDEVEPDGYCSPRHRSSSHSRDEGSQCV